MANIGANLNIFVNQYFTLNTSEHKAICNICCNTYYFSHKYTSNLEKHLISLHPEIITEIREQIRLTELSSYFKFNIEYNKTRCTIGNCRIYILHGINYLRDHLYIFHNIDTKALQSIKENEDVPIQQSLATDDNSGVNVDGQQPGPSLQAVEYKNAYPQYIHTLIREYFTPRTSYFIECKICHGLYVILNMFSLENHIIYSHHKTMEEKRNEVKHSDIARYFVIDEKRKPHLIKCVIENCIINIYSGINRLRNHLRNCHDIQLHANAFQNVQKEEQ